MTSAPLSPCNPGTDERVSGVSEGADASKEELQLGVLPDLAGLGELTLARGNLRVVTVPEGSSRMRASIDAVESAVWKLGGRAINLLVAEWEKKRGDAGPSGCCWAVKGGPTLKVEVGIFSILEGDFPVRGFLMGDGSMMPSVNVCLGDDRFALLQDRVDFLPSE